MLKNPFFNILSIFFPILKAIVTSIQLIIKQIENLGVVLNGVRTILDFVINRVKDALEWWEKLANKAISFFQDIPRPKWLDDLISNLKIAFSWINKIHK